MEVAELFAAFETLRALSDPSHPDGRSAWAAIFQWIRLRCGKDSDLHQETLLAVIRYRAQCTATEPLGVAKWISTIYSRKRIDAFRRAKHDRSFVTLDDGTGIREEETRIQVAAPTAGAHADELLHAFVDTVENTFLRDLPAELKDERKTLLRVQVRLALLRELLDYDLSALNEAVPPMLSDGTELKSDRIYKWVERGRQALAAWLRLPPDHLDEDLRRALSTRFGVDAKAHR